MPVAFDEVVEKITDAARHVEADGGASPVLVAVVREFQAKLGKAEKQATDGVPGRDSVMELEQAGDSAKAAAEADAGLSSDARESVLAAHLAICKLKAGPDRTARLVVNTARAASALRPQRGAQDRRQASQTTVRVSSNPSSSEASA